MRARSAFDAGADPYENVELETATRLGGAMLLVAFAFAAVSLALSAPLGPLGWYGVAACMVLALASGLHLVRLRRPARPAMLLAGVYLSLAAVGAYRASAGAGAPFEQLLFIVALYACAIHPARRALLVLGFASAIACTPGFYEAAGDAFLIRTIGQLLLIWCVGLIVAGWMTRVRWQRGEAKANSELARIDALTALSNRRALEEALPAAVSHTRRHNRPLSVLVADMDDFKGINDAFGHQAGDDMLRKAAQSITAAVRLSDPCFRWGGDEFVALLPEAAYGEALDIAERVRSTVALSCRTPDGGPLRITVGAAQLGPGENGEDLVCRADAALLEHKARRNAARVST